MFQKIYSIPAILALVLNFSSASFAKEGDAAFSVSPDSAFISLTTALTEARVSIDVNVYMLTSKNIASVISRKAAQGVKVRVLVEGEPHGGTVFPAVKQTLDQLNLDFKTNAAKNAALYVMTGNGDAKKRRYVFNHAKYVVVDGKKVFVSSDNFTGSAFPDPSRTIFAGGTRGWQLYLESASVAKELGKIFETDVTGNKDVVPYEKANLKVVDPNNGPLPNRDKRTAKAFGIELGRAEKGAICASPQSEKCILDFIRSAKKELLVEHLSLPHTWWLPDVPARDNPIMTELVAAARRGVQVKVLINDERAFNDGEDKNKDRDPKQGNDYSVTYLNEIAAKEKLPLQAALFNGPNTQTNYLHNKGMLADDKKIFVSSINGTLNSVERNREIAVSLESVEGARYFEEVFNFDWENRKKN